MKPMLELSYLKEACSLSGNVEENTYKANLKLAEKELRHVLGSEFYAELQSQSQDDSFTAINRTLYNDYVKDFLAWQTYFFYLGFAQSHSTPTGIREFNDDNSSIVADVKLYSLEKNVRKQAVDCKWEIINYLRLEREKDPSAFPKWVDSCREEFSFAISGITRNTTRDNIITVNKAIERNE